MKRPLSPSEYRSETRAIWTFVIIIVLLFGLALYGYFTGAWDQPSSSSSIPSN